MNIFEDLIDELKEENLIEQTVIETSQAEADSKALKDKTPPVETMPANQQTTEQQSPTAEKMPLEARENLAQVVSLNGKQPSANNADFFRKRAMEEVAFLQMVEAVFAGVEREYLKIIPKPYDDLEVKKVLHAFIQVSHDTDSPEHLQAQFQLLQETESWHSSLAMRDERIMTANLRRYCENSRPPLSSPAIIALARFYRNSPYSEQVRSKFDLIITRLFSKETGSRRKMLFSRAELIEHIAGLYADWSSIPLYSTEKDDTQITRTAKEFEEFIIEAEAATSFDELINNNFYNRLRIFKESTNEDFYAPLVAAMGIEVNIRVGNRYVELLDAEKEKGNIAGLKEKYGLTQDSEISEATGKTLLLAELLKQKAFALEPAKEKMVAREELAAPEAEWKSKKETSEKNGDNLKNNLNGINKWLIVATLLAIVVSFGLYFWAATMENEQTKPAATDVKLNIEN